MTPPLLIIPGLRDDAPQHWQSLLVQEYDAARSLHPLGRENLSLQQRIRDLEQAVLSSVTPPILVAHSGGCVLLAHWALTSTNTHRVASALLATPPTFDKPLPTGYPTLEALDAAGWLPVPRQALPFRSLVAVSSNDPLGEHNAVCALAQAWGSDTVELGQVGHLNPASGFGPWPQALELIQRLS